MLFKNSALSKNHVNSTKLLSKSRGMRVSPNSLRYALKFVSIVTPSTLKNLRLLASTDYERSDSHNKILIKQSYLLLTWLVYVRGTYSSTEANVVPAFFVQPISQTKLTNLKAPMAHKTFSQEQFLFKKYSLTISFKHNLVGSEVVSSVNSSIFIALSMRAQTPFFNTNLLFLKRFAFSFNSHDSLFMSVK
jgi:hypothetical protein